MRIKPIILYPALIALFVIPGSTLAQNVVLTLDEGDCVVPLQNNSAVTVSATGDITLDVSDSALPTCFGSQGGAAIDVSLSVTPTNVDDGDNVTVNWSVAGFIDTVTTCTATGGATAFSTQFAASPEAGSGTFSLNADTNFTVSCQNAGDSDVVAVTVNNPTGGGGEFGPPPAFCGPTPANREINFNIFRDFVSNPPNGQPKNNYEDTWGLWPGNDASTVLIPRGEYVAIPFRANETPGKLWRMDWVGGPSNGQASQVTVSLCPGDFSGVGYSDTFCAVNSGSEGSSLLGIIGADALACDLVQNEIYYLNVRHTGSDGSNQCFESNQRCGFRGAPSVLN